MRIGVQLCLLPVLFGLSYWLASRGQGTGKSGPTDAASEVEFELPWADQWQADPAAALANLAKSEQSYAKLASAVKAWAVRDADAAWRYVQSLPHLGWKQRLGAVILEHGLVTNTTAAEIWSVLPDRLQTPFLAEKMAVAFLRVNLEAAIAQAEKMPASDLKAAFLKSVIEQWSQKDVTAAAAFLEKQAPSMLRELQLHLAIAWGRLDPQKAVRWLESLSDADKDTGFSSILANLALRDVATAEKLLQQAQNPPAAAVAALAGSMAASDGPAALAWAAGLLGKLDANGRQQVWQSIFEAWAKTDPKSALAAALGETEAAGRGIKLQSSAETWALSHGSDALAHAKSLPAEDAAAVYRALLAGSGAGKTEDLTTLLTTRKTAYDELSSLGQAPLPQDSAHAGSITAKWAETQPTQALDWAKGLPGAGREQGLVSGLHLGMETQYDQTLSWYQSQPMEIQQLGLPGAVRGASRYHPETAMQWLTGSTHPQANALREEVWNGWLSRDSTSANRWKTTLPPAP